MPVTEALPRRRDLPPTGATVHLLGAAGAGMRGLARLLGDAGYRLTGSDRERAAAGELAALGIDVHPEDAAGPVREADLVVYSSAIDPDHPGRREAQTAGVPTWKRAVALGALVNDRQLAAVAGTHGKTTVTAMVARILEATGADPLAVVGGHVAEWRGNARPGSGPAVVEADEYDRSFLTLDPALAVVTSIEPEHLESYGDRAALLEAFETFARRALPRAGVLVCADDPGAVELGLRLGTAVRYGFAATADFRVEILARDTSGQTLRFSDAVGPLEAQLPVSGAHNAQNAAAAVAAALRLGTARAAAAEALGAFTGVQRRLERLSGAPGPVVVDDYAHHPTEVAASLAALREAWPDHRLVVVFQPHLYTRTRRLAAEFAGALAGADECLVLPVYGAREEPIPGVDAAMIVDRAPGHVVEADAEAALRRVAEATEDTVVAFMGAGDVTGLAHRAAVGGADDAVGG